MTDPRKVIMKRKNLWGSRKTGKGERENTEKGEQQSAEPRESGPKTGKKSTGGLKQNQPLRGKGESSQKKKYEPVSRHKRHQSEKTRRRAERRSRFEKIREGAPFGNYCHMTGGDMRPGEGRGEPVRNRRKKPKKRKGRLDARDRSIPPAIIISK